MELFILQMETQVLVIGGGATGAGILWDLTLRGIDAVLVEQRELARGTTGRCHGLLHSGGRYVVQDSDVARECYEENKILCQVAAPAVERTGGLFVYLKGDDEDYVECWLKACKSTDIPCEEIDLIAAHTMEPLLSKDAQRVFQVPDAAVDPFDLVKINLRGSMERGARVLTYTKLQKLIVEGNRVRGALLADMSTGESFTIGHS